MPRTKSKKITKQSKVLKPGRNGNGVGSLRQKTVKGQIYWEGRCSVPDPLTGKTKQRSFSGKTQAEVFEKMTTAQAEVRENAYVAPSKQTLGEWLDFWLDTYVKPSVKPYTYDSYRCSCENHIKPALGTVRLSALSPVQIQYFYNNVLLMQKGLSPKTIKNIHGTLHKAL